MIQIDYDDDHGSHKSGSNPLDFSEALTLVFIALKLSGHIDWKWYIVLCPLLFNLVFSIIGIFIQLLINTFISRKHRRN